MSVTSPERRAVYMEQNVKREINIADLWRIFTKNVKLFVILALIAAVVGGAVGGVLAYKNVSYQTTLNFSLLPTDDTDALLYNLQSEAFAERLLLDENGLPEKSECDPEDYAAALTAIEVFNAARAEKKEIKKELNKVQTAVEEFNMDYYNQRYNEIVSLLQVYKGAYTDVIADAESHKAMITRLETELLEVEEKRSAASAEYESIMLQKAELTEKWMSKVTETNEARRNAKALAEVVLNAWREDPEVRSKVETIMNSVTYSYAKLDGADSSTKTATSQNKGYIKITVCVDNDKEMADFIVDELKRTIPSFVEHHIEEVSLSVQVDCYLISTVSSPKRVGDNPVVNAAIFGVIGGIALPVLAYIILLFKELLLIYATPETDDKKQIEAATEDK